MNGVYIFIGRSGAGKGTQVKLLEAKIKQVDPLLATCVIETGKKFRELIASETYTGKKIKEMVEKGELPPPFAGVHMWSHCLIEAYTGSGAVFIDGTPRVPEEVPLLLSAVEFYGWEAHVINLQVSDEWSYEHIKARGRADDAVEEEVWGRIQWFHQSVEPAIALLRESPLITFHDIVGEQTIEAVHADICEILGL
ncbi:MAG: adenylate kinase family protein [Minisyncoccia bacterium]